MTHGLSALCAAASGKRGLSAAVAAISIVGFFAVVGAFRGVDAQVGRTTTTLSEFTQTAERIVRGRCIAAETGFAEVAGARIPVTTYTLGVSDPLKGVSADTIDFRQVGVPDGGISDLGRRVGLPTYQPGADYVLFLLPESVAALTSPAGAGEGAFVVGARGEVVPMTAAGRHLLTRGSESMPYKTLRKAVVQELTK